MSAFTSGVQTALQADAPLIFMALRVELPGYTLRLLDGAQQLTVNGEVYVGRDDTYGVAAAVDEIDDGTGDQVPALSISIHPPNDEAAIALNDPAVQGGEVQVWFGVVDRATGEVIPDPELLFIGEIDVPTLRAGKGRSLVDLDCVSAMERLFENEEGVRLADSFQQLRFPGETGLANVTGVEKKVYWGVEGAGGAISR